MSKQNLTDKAMTKLLSDATATMDISDIIIVVKSILELVLELKKTIIDNLPIDEQNRYMEVIDTIFSGLNLGNAMLTTLLNIESLSELTNKKPSQLWKEAQKRQQ